MRVAFLCGGVCTTGLGKIVDVNFQNEMRSIYSSLPAQSKDAINFYYGLGNKLAQKNIVIDSFIFSVEEVGLTEMLPCLKATGGLLVQHEEFNS
jgi:hypothetical protein